MRLWILALLLMLVPQTLQAQDDDVAAFRRAFYGVPEKETPPIDIDVLITQITNVTGQQVSALENRLEERIGALERAAEEAEETEPEPLPPPVIESTTIREEAPSYHHTCGNCECWPCRCSYWCKERQQFVWLPRWRWGYVFPRLNGICHPRWR